MVGTTTMHYSFDGLVGATTFYYSFDGLGWCNNTIPLTAWVGFTIPLTSSRNNYHCLLI
jgi:hypothetical protein